METSHQSFRRWVVILAMTGLASCAGQPAQIANPASTYCVEAGGQPLTETRPDGNEFGVCLFEDNRQCGEWALFRGECPVGGLRVAGFPSDAARFCAITGASYQVDGTRETCKTRNGTICGLAAYFNGTCR